MLKSAYIYFTVSSVGVMCVKTSTAHDRDKAAGATERGQFCAVRAEIIPQHILIAWMLCCGTALSGSHSKAMCEQGIAPLSGLQLSLQCPDRTLV